MKKQPPDIIYLQWYDDFGEPNSEPTWCEDMIEENDIKYQRVDKKWTYYPEAKPPSELPSDDGY